MVKRKKLIEREPKSPRLNYKEIILKTVFATTILSVALMAPNALQLFRFLDSRKKTDAAFRLRAKANEMIRKGFIVQTKSGLSLTEKGQAALLKYHGFQIKRPKRWDGTWTIVSYDVLDKKKSIRDAVRFYLKRIGFHQLQKSVWVFPYDCPELIYLVKTEWKLKDELVYIRAKYISREKELKEYFDL